MVENEINILIAGVGGQGNILASKIIAEAALHQGRNVIVGEVFGVSQRGGSVISHVRLGGRCLSPLSPEHGSEIICGLEPMEALRAASIYVKSNGLVISNSRPHQPVAVNRGKVSYPPIEKIQSGLKKLCLQVTVFDATLLAERAGSPMAANIVLVGALSVLPIIDLPVSSFEIAIEENMPKAIKTNHKAFHLGREEMLRLSKN